MALRAGARSLNLATALSPTHKRAAHSRSPAQENSLVTSTYLNSLVELVEQHLLDDGKRHSSAPQSVHFANTLAYIRRRKEGGCELYNDVQCSA